MLFVSPSLTALAPFARRTKAMPRPPVILGRQASLWVSAAVVTHTLWTSAAPAMAYRLYVEHWQLSHNVTAGIFAVYPIVVVAVLTLFGDLSDHIGRRAAMLLGLAASLAGALCFALAPGVTWLFLGRALMGLGVGLSAGPSTAAVLEFNGEAPAKRAAVITAVAQSVGFALALLLGGALTQYAPWPMRFSFWVLAAVITLLFAAAWFLPRSHGAAGGWRPRMPSVPTAVRRPFALAALAVVTAYIHGVMILSLGGQMAHDLVGSPNELVNGAVLALFAIVSGLVGFFAKSLLPRMAMLSGAVASTAGMALLGMAAHSHSLPLFLLATATTGAGYSLLFLSALELVNRAAPAQQRGGVLSALYLLGYLSLGVVAQGLGAVASLRNLGVAIDLGAGLIAGFSLATLLLTIAMRGVFTSQPER